MRRIETLIEPLTPRELEILALLAKHLTNKEIASSLSLSVNSVKWYARQIYGKLGIENRRQVVARAGELGLLSTIPSADAVALHLKSLESKPKHNLPLQLTSFIGRGEEIKQIKRLLGSSRLVTLTGAGGVGKTRLALAIAWQMLDDFKNGIWMVELAPVGDPEIIPETIAAVFGVRADQNRSLRTALLDYLREKQLLMILDNCEHLIDACAGMADTILRACPQVRVLASSREALGIDGEAPFYVPSLSFPEPGKPVEVDDLQGYEAVQLFLERARLVVPGFEITNANAFSLTQICNRLDGIPLALELAAARLQVLSLEQIADRLDDRFRLLTGGSRRALPRHQTLYALIDWSYELLSEAERILFRRLSVFAGQWTLEAAEAVCIDESLVESSSTKTKPSDLSSSEIIDLLEGLVNKSLILVERVGDEVRCYRMLETIRQYAQEKLLGAGEAERLRDRHLDYFMSLAEQSETLLRGPDVLQCLEMLDEQIDNLRLALSWALGGRQDKRVIKGLNLASELYYYWYFSGLVDEGINYLTKGIEILSTKNTSWAKQCAKASFVAAELILFTGDFSKLDDAHTLLEDSLTLYERCQDQVGMAMAQCALGQSLMEKYISTFRSDIDRVEYPMARALGEQGLTTCRSLGEPADLAFALMLNLYIYSEGMDFSAAQAYGEEGLTLCEKLGDKMILGGILIRLGTLTLIQNDLLAAKRYFQKALALAQEIKDKIGMINAHGWLGLIASQNQDYEKKEKLFKFCLELSQETGLIVGQLVSYRALASELVRQAKLMEAKEYLLTYLSLAMNTGGYEYDQRYFVLGMAEVAQGLGQLTQAARLLGAAEAQFESFFKPLDPWDQAGFDLIASEVRRQMDEANFTSAWVSGRELSLEQAIEEARQIIP